MLTTFSPNETTEGYDRRLACTHCEARTLEEVLHPMESPLSALGAGVFNDMARISLDSVSDAVLAVDTKGLVLYLNKVAEKLTGWSREEAKGRPVEQVFFVFDDTIGGRAQSPAQRAINEGQAVKLALGNVLIRRDGMGIAIEDSATPIRNHEGTTTGAVIVFHDARQSRSALRKMSHHAQHDFLTGLPNRMLLMERLTQAIGLANRHGKQIALLFMDLDNFKRINDTQGHTVGDNLLRDVAAEIMNCVRTTDTVSRHGGDEFVVLLSEIEVPYDAVRVAKKLLARFAEPRNIEGRELQATLSIGISIYPEDGCDAGILMGNADMAMYATKESGRNSYRLFQQLPKPV